MGDNSAGSTPHVAIFGAAVPQFKPGVRERRRNRVVFTRTG